MAVCYLIKFFCCKALLRKILKKHYSSDKAMMAVVLFLRQACWTSKY